MAKVLECEGPVRVQAIAERQSAWLFDKVSIFVRCVTGFGADRRVGYPVDEIQYREVDWEEQNLGGGVGPLFTLVEEDAQALFQSLWDCGFRPADFKGSDDALAEARNHVASLKLWGNEAFGLLGQALGGLLDRHEVRGPTVESQLRVLQNLLAHPVWDQIPKENTKEEV